MSLIKRFDLLARLQVVKVKLSLLKISVMFFLFASQINSSEDLSAKTSIFDNENQKHLLQIEIQRFILENPEIIIHAIELYKQKKFP